MNRATTSTYADSRKFRLKILASALDAKWMAMCGRSVIVPEYFEKDDESKLAEALLKYYDAYGKPPSDACDILEMCGSDYADIVKTVFLGAYEWDLSFAKDRAIQFAKEQAAKIAILESVDDIKKGDLKRPLERIQAAVMVGEDIGNVGLDFKADMNNWLYNLYSDKVPTGLHHVDMVLEGGLAAGELGIVLAPPNRGKSMLLVNIGMGAAGPTSRLNVLHFTHEMSENVVAKRYSARITFRFPKRNDDITAYEKELMDAIKHLMMGNVRIVYELAGVATIETLRAKVRQVIDIGFKPDLIIDDYPDLLAPTYHKRQRRFELAQIFRDLRTLGAEFGVPVWAATQTNRSAVSKEVVTIVDLAEAFEKAAIADVIVALCQTPEEEENDLCRLYLAKVRDGKSKAMISAKYYDEQQAIITIGMVSRRDE